MAQVLSDGGGQLGCVDDARPDVVRLDPGGVWATPRSASPSIFTPTSLQRSPERQPTPLAASSSGRDRPDRKAPAQLGGRWSENAHLVGPSSVTPPPEIGSDFERSKMPVCVPERTVARGAWAVRYWRGDRQRCFGGVVVWEYPESSVWGKAMCPGFAAECRILPVLAQRRPDKVLEPRRVDSDRASFSCPMAGRRSTPLSTRWRGPTSSWGTPVCSRTYEQPLLAAGCIDLRPRSAVQRLVQHMESGAVDHRQHLIDWLGAVADELSDEIPSTIQHDDLQPANVLLDGRILDWGDASLAHPFASLLTALMPGNPRRPGTPPERRAMRDEYLASWAAHLGLEIGNPTTSNWLCRQVDLAMLIAPIGRIDTWLRAPQGALQQYPDEIDRWIDHLERSYADPPRPRPVACAG